MNKVFYISVFSLILIFSCKKKFDLPPTAANLPESGRITIDSIIKKYVAYYNAIPKPTALFRFPDDVNLYCKVTADEKSGNIYKTVYVKDNTAALQVKLLNTGGLYVGDSIRINLRNIILNDYGDMIQLDSVDIEKKVVKISSGNSVTPKRITFTQMLLLNGNGHSPFQSQLVTVDSVEFIIGHKGLPFADAVGKNSIDRLLMNSFNQEVIVRSSGYSNFAANIIPCGKGSLTAIVSQYNDDVQLIIRDFNEVKLNQGNCPLLIKAFDDFSLLSGGWTNYNVSGSINWGIDSYNGQVYGKISNYVGGSNIACETWFISPSLDIASAANPYLTFRSAYNYSGPALEVLVSTNYTGGNPTSATWTSLNPNLSSGSWDWINSGNVSLSSHKSANTRFAFKYSGTASDGSTWEIDDIALFAE
ncbi:MAG: DUF5689 domain-containing protein [Bacteroidia bacterium]